MLDRGGSREVEAMGSDCGSLELHYPRYPWDYFPLPCVVKIITWLRNYTIDNLLPMDKRTSGRLHTKRGNRRLILPCSVRRT